MRIVRTPADGVKVDPTGKLAGRGAYLCRARTCWQKALTSNRLASALKTELEQDEVTALGTYAATLPEERPVSNDEGARNAPTQTPEPRPTG